MVIIRALSPDVVGLIGIPVSNQSYLRISHGVERLCGRQRLHRTDVSRQTSDERECEKQDDYSITLGQVVILILDFGAGRGIRTPEAHKGHRLAL